MNQEKFKSGDRVRQILSISSQSKQIMTVKEYTYSSAFKDNKNTMEQNVYCEWWNDKQEFGKGYFEENNLELVKD